MAVRHRSKSVATAYRLYAHSVRDVQRRCSCGTRHLALYTCYAFTFYLYNVTHGPRDARPAVTYPITEHNYILWPVLRGAVLETQWVRPVFELQEAPAP